MHHGISAPNAASPAQLVALAVDAERSGWDGYHLSGGRMVFGVGLGRRPHDSFACPLERDWLADLHRRLLNGPPR